MSEKFEDRTIGELKKGVKNGLKQAKNGEGSSDNDELREQISEIRDCQE